MKAVTNKGNHLLLIVGFLYFAVGDVGRLLGLIGLPREIAYGLFFLLFLLFVIQRITRLKVYDVLIVMVIFSVVVLGTLRYGQYISSFTNKLAPLLIFFPSYVFFRLYDFEKIEAIFEKTSLFSGIFLLIYYILVVRRSGLSYSMSYAYWITFPIICFTGLFLRKRNIVFLVLDILMLFTLVISGSRGALLLTVVCIFYLIITDVSNQERLIKKIVIVSVIGLITVITVYFYDDILSYLSQYSSISRNLRMLLNGKMFESKTRDDIYEICRQLIDQNKWGYGPLASRQLLSGHNYPHSLWYELQLDYGQIPGMVLFAIIIFMTVLNLIRYRNKNERIIVSFISIVGIGSLMVSSSYFYELFVPATIAMYINWNLHYKNRISSDNKAMGL